MYSSPDEDPTNFVATYVRRLGLPKETGTSMVEKECIRKAREVREDYKEMCVRSSLDDRKDNRNKLRTVQEKHERRLEINRIAGRCHKVYSEALHRFISAHLLSIEEKQKSNESQTCRYRNVVSASETHASMATSESPKETSDYLHEIPVIHSLLDHFERKPSTVKQVNQSAQQVSNGMHLINLLSLRNKYNKVSFLTIDKSIMAGVGLNLPLLPKIEREYGAENFTGLLVEKHIVEIHTNEEGIPE